MSDDGVLAAQLGRPLKAPAKPVVRCHLGLPIVSEVPGELADGTPFPTSYWLACPLARRRIGRLEGEGGVKRWDDAIAADPTLTERMAAAQDAYPGGRGIGGTRGSVKCLHAHAAYAFAGGETPAGEWARDEISPLLCVSPCVLTSDEGARSNPAWRPEDQT